jgi:PAS domain S-box-containing protein
MPKESEQTQIEKALVGTSIYNIIKYIPVGIVFLECPNGKITYANDRAIELYGVNPLGLEIKDQATKLMTLFCSNGEPYATEKLPMTRGMKGTTVTNEELIIQRHKDSSRIIVSANAVPIKNEKGAIVGAVGVFADITERRKLEETLSLHRQKLEELVEKQVKQIAESERLAAIGQTAGMVGHDIRNPLQSMAGELYLAKSEIENIPDLKTKEELKNCVTNIQEQIDYINKIVSDLQDFAKPLIPSIKEVSLGKVIQNVLSNLNIPETIKVICSVEGTGLKLKCDPDFLKRILINLATNAIQAMPEGGSLTINANEKDGKVFISIEDTGEGLPDEIKGKPFMPFVTTKAKGQGLGLAVVKRLTNTLNGEISFESEKGKGTKFMLEFPEV